MVDPRMEFGVESGLAGGESCNLKFVRSEAKKAETKAIVRDTPLVMHLVLFLRTPQKKDWRNHDNGEEDSNNIYDVIMLNGGTAPVPCSLESQGGRIGLAKPRVMRDTSGVEDRKRMLTSRGFETGDGTRAHQRLCMLFLISLSLE